MFIKKLRYIPGALDDDLSSDPMRSYPFERLECTLNCDASIKFACSKFPKPCYESVNFEISCRSIITDGFSV